MRKKNVTGNFVSKYIPILIFRSENNVQKAVLIVFIGISSRRPVLIVFCMPGMSTFCYGRPHRAKNAKKAKES